MIEINPQAITAAISAAVGSAATVATLLGKVRKVIAELRGWADRAEQFWTDWNGVAARPGVPGRSGVMERLAGMEARQTGVEQTIAGELKDNHGSSLKDAMRRTESAVAAIQAQLDRAHLIALPAPAQPAAEPPETKGEAA